MFWCKRCNNICDVLNFVDFYLCIMFMEYFVIFLGFVKLKFLILVICLIIICFVVVYMNYYYILSIIFRNIMYYVLIYFGDFIKKLWLYGFCFNFYLGSYEKDYSLCMVC